jgi:hypothetical protein
MFTLMAEYFYAMALCTKDGLLLVADPLGRVYNPAETK